MLESEIKETKCQEQEEKAVKEENLDKSDCTKKVSKEMKTNEDNVQDTIIMHSSNEKDKTLYKDLIQLSKTRDGANVDENTFAELEGSPVTEDTMNIAAVMQSYVQLGDENAPSFVDYQVALDEDEDSSDDFDGETDGCTFEKFNQSDKASTSTEDLTPSLQICTKEVVKLSMAQANVHRESDYDELDNKILKFQNDKEQLNESLPDSVNVKDLDEGVSYCDSDTGSPRATNSTIGGLIDMYSEHESSCPTFLDYNIMEEIMTMSSDEENEH